jgi:hypothetical protein
LTRQDNTSISAVAVMRQPSGSALVIDLYHNPHARVPIPPTLAAPLVRKQYAKGLDDPDRQEPNVLDLMQTAEGKEWLHCRWNASDLNFLDAYRAHPGRASPRTLSAPACPSGVPMKSPSADMY